MSDRIRLTPELIEEIAGRFKALAEPARLQILNCLRHGEMTVTGLVDETRLGQANLSRHLQSLYAAGFVGRRKEGLFVFYFFADTDVLELCDIMCGRVQQEFTARRRVLVPH